MTDIVERLRSLAIAATVHPEVADSIMEEAADEIERLRKFEEAAKIFVRAIHEAVTEKDA